ncbi:MAG: VanZ family protein [Candidatus Thiodiazotropha weberae]|nr:VanZ family protein [Candidatus Thiodiazotropha lotti]MCW4211053.1 VanZ family protein [Candidatus Thiodiazotropha lotti]
MITAIVLLGTNLPATNHLMFSLQDSGHYLIFALLTLVVLSRYRDLRRQQLWLLMSLILLFGILVEAAQATIERDPSVYDVLMDILGITAGAVIYRFRIKRSLPPNFALLTLLALSLVAFAMPLYWLTVYQVRAAQFPRLIDPDRVITRVLTEGSHGVELRHLKIPKDWILPVDLEIENCAYVSLLDGRWPGVGTHEPESNWQGYETFDLAIYSDQTKDLSLTLRINDQSHNEQYDDRYNLRLLARPGYNHFSFPLSEIAHGPKYRSMDMGDISNVLLFSTHENRGAGFCLMSMELR